ncbi:hypothetical protein BV898_08841 [Hypsibius exemplaris]|uniref:Uncharacterized protein n=1 Tax=Hypsibius exemplaris TaxID=2072580 RepID=A0A1W0WPK1_HYPEX|nr:hypothetical protein BV898_08841 [Hypsibius exemplaris]
MRPEGRQHRDANYEEDPNGWGDCRATLHVLKKDESTKITVSLDFEEVLDAIRPQRMWELKLTSRRELNIESGDHGLFVRYVNPRDLRQDGEWAIHPRDEDPTVAVTRGRVIEFRSVGEITPTRTTPELEILNVRRVTKQPPSQLSTQTHMGTAHGMFTLAIIRCTPAFSLTGIPTTVSDRRRDGYSPRRRHAQTVDERNAMTASPEDLAEYDIEDETTGNSGYSTPRPNRAATVTDTPTGAAKCQFVLGPARKFPPDTNGFSPRVQKFQPIRQVEPPHFGVGGQRDDGSGISGKVSTAATEGNAVDRSTNAATSVNGLRNRSDRFGFGLVPASRTLTNFTSKRNSVFV